jgi:Zn-dependent membrane protease YugP
MLRENGIYDVKVVSVQGFLSDHYNPANKTIIAIHSAIINLFISFIFTPFSFNLISP